MSNQLIAQVQTFMNQLQQLQNDALELKYALETTLVQNEQLTDENAQLRQQISQLEANVHLQNQTQLRTQLLHAQTISTDDIDAHLLTTPIKDTANTPEQTTEVPIKKQNRPRKQVQLTTKSAPAVSRLLKLYDEDFHICTTYYGQLRQGATCDQCLAFLNKNTSKNG